MRGRLELLHDILYATLILKDHATKTSIMQRSYLNTKTFSKHFRFVLEKGFVAKSENRYELTAHGKNLLKQLREIKNAITL